MLWQADKKKINAANLWFLAVDLMATLVDI